MRCDTGFDQRADGRRLPRHITHPGGEIGERRQGFRRQVLRQNFGLWVQVDVEHLGRIGQFVEVGDALLVEADDCFQRRRGGHRDATRFEARLHQRAQPCVVGQLEVMGVQPVQLLGVELRGRRRDVVEVEPFAELLHRENFLVAVRPAEAGQVVEHGFRQIAFVVVLHHAHRAVALRELLPVVAEDHRQVRVERHLRAERGEDVDLARRVIHVIVATDDVGDLHIPVVNDDAEIVGRRAVGARDHQIVEFGIGDLDAALDEVVPGHHAIERIAEAHDRQRAGWWGRQRLAGLRAPGAVITRLEAPGAQLLAHVVELFRCCVAVVGRAGGEHLGNHRLVALHALHLVERAFIVRQAQPVHSVENGLHGLGRRAGDIGILDAQDEGAGVTAGVSPREECSAGAANVQEASRGGRITGADHGRSSEIGKRVL